MREHFLGCIKIYMSWCNAKKDMSKLERFLNNKNSIQNVLKNEIIIPNKGFYYQKVKINS